ncbi:hypothetical protein GCM10010193_31640 [Kitasatospora atroaurantiaca]|uniref:Serine/threonine protein kinase n=1 Tax=Kitasatospora atroaurantiaca TaxID=285545 RepID=A0A561ERA8_9ACTN|nr:protein kinase [Kitasatospora atroaurantiaca]TWE18150.1 serine/threonine protein kinase [Kitasatospora atroaurantiaca]
MTAQPETFSAGPAKEATVPPGYRVGDWEITDFIAAGSWGSVYAARRCGAAAEGEPTEAALKFLSTSGLAPRQARELAETADREVAFSRSDAHPHLIRVYDTAVVSDPELPAVDGAVVLIMERADRSLLDLLAQSPTSSTGTGSTEADADTPAKPGPPTPAPGTLLVQIGEALAHLHASGWIHGDLKPGNILLMADGTIRLADFGLAARIEGTHGYAPPMGSPDYLPPERRTEQLSERGVPTRPSLDVWAFGVTAHQLLTGGSFAFPGATPAARAAAVHEYGAGRTRLRLAPELSPAWHAILADCLAADPSVRAAHTMESLLPRIRAAAEGTQARARWRPRAILLAAGALLTAAGIAAALLWPSVGGDQNRPTTAQVRVFNIDGSCKDQSERMRACSLGLARDPHRKYDADNVVGHRVWHADVLTTDCVVNDGDRVEDETGIGTPRWFRVQLDDIPEGHAWLPSVRTHDDPQIPVCATS